MKKRIISTLLSAMMIFSISGTSNYASAAVKDVVEETNQFDGDESYQMKDEANTEEGYELADNPLPVEYYNTIKSKAVNNDYNGAISGYTPRKLTTAGKVNNIVVFIKFKGESDESVYPKKTIDKIMNAYNDESKSLGDYYNTVSRGKLDVNGVFPQVNGDNVVIYEAPMEYSVYKNDYDIGRDMLKDALKSVKNKISPNLVVDADKDGFIDEVTFFVTHEANHAEFLWPHSFFIDGDNDTKINGANICDYNLITVPSFNRSGFKVLVHEFGHTLGFPDYYTGTGTTTLVGNWSVMSNTSSGGCQTVYERAKYTDWVNESQIPAIRGIGTYEVSDSTQDPSKNTIGYKIKIVNSNQYFMVEYRNKNANIYESTIPSSGLVVSRVKPAEEGNYSGGKEECILTSGTNNANSSALNETSANKTIKLVLEDGTFTGFTVNYISESNGKIKFSIKCDTDPIIINKTQISNTNIHVGDTINIASDATGGGSLLKYKFTYLVNGKETMISDYSFNNKCTWTPSKTGIYTIKTYVTDGEKEVASTEFGQTIKVSPVQSTKSVIYYNKKSNFTGSNVYIHYNKNGEGWTKVPGELMTPTTEKAGYNYKFTIDLSKLDGSLVFCFNDGNNHWDSKNGANYTSNVGTYGVSNEVTKKMDDVFEIDSLASTYNQCTVMGTTNISASAINGKGIINYRFSAINASGVETLINDYSSEDSVSWRPSNIGTYTLKVQAKDEDNKVVTKTILINVVKKASATGTFDKQSPQEARESIQVKLNAIGGTGDIEYQLIARGGNYLNGQKDIYVQNYSTNNVINWVPEMDGTYQLLADLRDATGSISRTLIGTYTITNTRNMEISSFTTDKVSPQTQYRGINITADSKYGVGDIEYQFEYQLEGEQPTILRLYSTSKGCYWYPSKYGKYTLTVKARDINGKTATKSMSFTIVEEMRIISFNADKVSPQPANTKIILNTKTTGGLGNIQYKYTFMSWDGSRTVLRDYETNSSFEWTPTESMIGYILVEAKDETASTQRDSQIYYEIQAPKENYVTIYYKSSWDKVYCHYQVNGKWTNVPGKEMTKIAAIDGGYNYKLQVNLGTTNNITWCFNNGSGQWDSRNGLNYSASNCVDKNLGVKDQSLSEITVGPQTISISSLVATPNQLELGSKVELKATTANATGKVGYTFTITKDGKDVSSSYNYDGVYNYTPVAEGTYTVKVVAQDTTSKTAEKTCTFTVGKKVETTKVTVYYKGFTNPNIHYKKQDGSWTSVPGVAMTLASNGYYTITLDIGTTKELVCCFNDGNGKWDSKNGQNYKLGVGTSYVKDGVIQSNPF